MKSNLSHYTTVFYGIDGCKSGWILVSLQGTEAGIELNIQLLSSLYELKELLDFSTLFTIWIDIPIGLSETEERICDKQLRKALGKKGASAFATPIRSAVYASSYQDASSLNFEQTGKKISIQSWNICPKIKQADEFLHLNEEFKPFFKESHPEYLFQTWRPNYFESKKTETGFNQRLAFLETHLPCIYQVNSFIESHKRSLFAKDDVLDALALAFAALQSTTNGVSFWGDVKYQICFPSH